PLRALLADLDLLVRESAAFDPASSTRAFRVVGTDYVHAVLTPSLLDAARREAPHARFGLLPFDPATVWSLLENDAADLAFVTGMTLPDARRLPGPTERFKVIQRKGHPRGPGPVSLDGFCAAEHVLVSPEGGGFVGAADRILADLGRERQVVCSLPSFLLAPTVVAGSDLIALIPERLARLHGDLVDAFDPPFPSPSFSVDILWHPRRQRDPAHVWVRTLAARAAAELERAARPAASGPPAP
ncbi:MAG: LysR substrate-binding domain-containing protein, partial [Pseudomonadota bacterium]